MRKTLWECEYLQEKVHLSVNDIIMKQRIIIFLFSLLYISCTSQRLMYIRPDENRLRLFHNAKTYYSENYIPQKINKDNTFNILLVDSIHLNLDSCLVIRQENNKQYFLFTNISGKNPPKSNIVFPKEYFLKSNNCYLLYIDTFMYWLGPIAKKSRSVLDYLKDSLNKDYPRKIITNNYFSICEYLERPSYFLLFLIRGDVYNNITVPMDSDFGSVFFSDKKAYYKVLVPVWEQTGAEN